MWIKAAAVLAHEALHDAGFPMPVDPNTASRACERVVGKPTAHLNARAPLPPASTGSSALGGIESTRLAAARSAQWMGNSYEG